MKIGIKYCGGCNPRYDRGKLLADLKTTFNDRHVFEVAQVETVYDALIVIGGCTSCCAKHGHLSVVGETWYVKSAEDYDTLIERLK